MLMKHTIVQQAAVWVIAISLAGLPTSQASEPDYDELYSYRFEKPTGYELSEEGVRTALENFDSLDLYQTAATISVVGEQRYTSLVAHLKKIYLRTPADKPESTPRANAWKYTTEFHLDYVRVRIVRALIRCGDPDAEEYAIKQALKAPDMESLSEGIYAIRNLKFLVEENDSDVLTTLIFIVETQQHREKLGWAMTAAREIVEIEHYLRETESPKFAECKQALDALRDQAPTMIQKTIDDYRNIRPTWSATGIVIADREAAR